MNDDLKHSHRPRWWLIPVISVWLLALLLLPPPYSGLKLWGTLLAALARIIWQIPHATKERLVALFLSLIRPILCLLRTVLRAAAGLVLPPDTTLPLIKVLPARIHWPTLIFGLVLLALLAEINGNMLHLSPLQRVSFHVQWVLLCAGIALAVWGLAGRNRLKPRVRATHELPLPTLPLVLITLVTLLAFALRLWQLEDALRTFVDEVNFSNEVLRFDSQPYTAILARSDPTMAFPRLFVYGQYLSVSLFGRTLEGLRLASVVAGTLTVPAMYLLGKRLCDRRTALVAALLLATFPPHLQFSRIGLNNVADPLVGTLLLAALARLTPARPLQNRLEIYVTQTDLVLAGVLLGLTQYFYEAGRYIFPALTIVWLRSLWLRGRLPARDLRLLFLTAVFVAMPVYHTVFAARLPFAPRLGVTSSVDLPYLPRLLATLLVYVSQPEMRLFIYYYGGHTALILPVLLPFFLGGVVYPRYVVAFPALALLGVGMCHALPGLLTWANCIARRGMIHHALTKSLIIPLAVVAALTQTIYYFGVHLPNYMEQIRREYGGYNGEDALLRAAELPDGTLVPFVNVSPPDEGSLAAKLLFLNGQLKVRSVRLEDADAYLAALDTESLAFFVAPFDIDTLALLQQHYRMDGPYYSHYLPLNRQFLLFLPQP